MTLDPSTRWEGTKVYGTGDAPSAPSSSLEDEADFPVVGDTCGFGDNSGPFLCDVTWGSLSLSHCDPQIAPQASCCTLPLTGLVRFEMLLLEWPGREIFICSWIFIEEI